MAMRWGLGPVFVCEWLVASRRWQMYAVRALVVAALLGALSFDWATELRDHQRQNPQQPLGYKDYSRIGESFFGVIVGTQLALILLAAPGATAGAVCLDKLRGNLLHLLVTDLSVGEIILGKLAARLLPVVGLVACSVPVLMIGTLLGGMDPYAVLGAYVVMLGVGVFGTALALLLSIWGRKPHEVLLVAYVIEVLWLLVHPIWWTINVVLFKAGSVPDWVRDLNPFAMAFAPYSRPNTVEWEEYARFLLATCGAALACTLLAAVSVRPLTIRQGAVTARPRTLSARARRRGGPLLDRNPLLWYEWHRKRPSRWVRVIWAVYALGALGGSGLVVYALFSAGRLSDEAILVNIMQVTIGLLFVGIGAVTALTEERVRGNLDVLLATPLSTRSIVWAKWRVAFRPGVRLAVLPTLLIALIVAKRGLWIVPPAYPHDLRAWLLACVWSDWSLIAMLPALILAYGVFLTSLGLALATWVARTGRAIGCWVSLYVLLCIGWPALVAFLSDGRGGGVEQVCPALASPIFGSGVLTEIVGRRAPDRAGEILTLGTWSAVWTLVLLGAGMVLYFATLLTFDRCLGRMPEHGRPRHGNTGKPFRRGPSPRGERGVEAEAQRG
jgi:ABC-type transport system involved in multi-copper enzyme maturation permease subunit